jgi:ABC-type dipeptide/oligopeptide/nickel transport system permease subunit
MVVFILGIASSIMAESSLSFLDAGIPDNWISWGTLSGNGKRHLENWWLLAVPGTLLLFTLLGLSVLADHYRRK